MQFYQDETKRAPHLGATTLEKPPSSKIYIGSVAQSAGAVARMAVMTVYHGFSGCPIALPSGFFHTIQQGDTFLGFTKLVLVLN